MRRPCHYKTTCEVRNKLSDEEKWKMVENKIKREDALGRRRRRALVRTQTVGTAIKIIGGISAMLTPLQAYLLNVTTGGEFMVAASISVALATAYYAIKVSKSVPNYIDNLRTASMNVEQLVDEALELEMKNKFNKKEADLIYLAEQRMAEGIAASEGVVSTYEIESKDLLFTRLNAEGLLTDEEIKSRA